MNTPPIIQTESTTQLLILLGVGLIVLSRPDLGVFLLLLGLVSWSIYNAINIGRQF